MRARQRGFILMPVALTLALVGALAWLMNRQPAVGLALATDTSRAQQARYVAEAGMNYAIRQMNDLDCTAPPASYALNLGSSGSAAVQVSSAGTNSYALRSTGTVGTATSSLTRTVTPLALATYTLPVPRTSGSGTSTPDTFIAADCPTCNFGRDKYLVVDNSAAGSANILLQFDLAAAGLNSDAHLLNATLQLTRAPYSLLGGLLSVTTTLGARKVTRQWDEGKGIGTTGSVPIVTTNSDSNSDATWNQARSSPAVVAWTAKPTGQTALGIGDVDGLVDQESVVVATLLAGVTSTVNFDLTAPAAEWMADPTHNYGVLIEADSAIQKLPFWSNGGAPAKSGRPMLTLTYQLPCGAFARPVVDVAFTSAQIGAGSNTTLTYTLSNWNASSLSNANLSNALPSGLTLVGSPVTTCGGTAGSTTSGGIVTITLSNGSIPAASGGTAGSCTVTATVTTSTLGTYTANVAAGDLTTKDINSSNIASDTLTVSTPAPSVRLDLPMTPGVWLGQRLIVTLGNSAGSAATVTSPFDNTLPPGVTASGVTTTCGGTISTLLVGGRQVVRMTGGSIPAGSIATPGTCTITVPLSAAAPGTYTDLIPAGALVTSLGTNSSPATLMAMLDQQDTTISNASGLADYSYGPFTPIWAFENGGPYRGLVQQNVTAIPSGTTILKARLRLYVSQLQTPTGAAIQLKAYAISQAWVEGLGGKGNGGADWQDRDAATGKAWSRAGVVNLAAGPTVIASTAVTGAGWIEFDVTSIVQAWVNGTSTNNGLLLVNANPNKNKDMIAIESRESATFPPQLMVTY